MSHQATTWAVRQQIVKDPTARHVLLCMANYAGVDGRDVYPSLSTLAMDTGLSVRTLQRKLDHLLELGVIRHGNPAVVAAAIPRADRRPPIYDLDMPRGDTVSPGSGEKSVQHAKQGRGVSERHPVPREVSRSHPVAPFMPPRGDTVSRTGCHSDTQIGIKKKERKKGISTSPEAPASEPPNSLSFSDQLNQALVNPDSAEAQAFLQATGHNPDRRPLWELASYLKRLLGTEFTHQQIQTNLETWAITTTPAEAKQAWLKAVARRKREPTGLRAVHHFVDILNGTYQPDSTDLQAARAAAAPQPLPYTPGDRVTTTTGETLTVTDVDEAGQWLIFDNHDPLRPNEVRPA